MCAVAGIYSSGWHNGIEVSSSSETSEVFTFNAQAPAHASKMKYLSVLHVWMRVCVWLRNKASLLIWISLESVICVESGCPALLYQMAKRHGSCTCFEFNFQNKIYRDAAMNRLHHKDKDSLYLLCACSCMCSFTLCSMHRISVLIVFWKSSFCDVFLFCFFLLLLPGSVFLDWDGFTDDASFRRQTASGGHSQGFQIHDVEFLNPKYLTFPTTPTYGTVCEGFLSLISSSPGLIEPETSEVGRMIHLSWMKPPTLSSMSCCSSMQQRSVSSVHLYQPPSGCTELSVSLLTPPSGIICILVSGI